VIVADFSKPAPLLTQASDDAKPGQPATINKDDIAFVYGSRWRQRYFKKVDDDYFLFSGTSRTSSGGNTL
jgi:hypothetical protein